MNIRRTLWLSAAAGTALWAFFSWPAPRYLLSGIPSAAHPEYSDAQVMTAGDHLQLLYHFWLAGDMAAGRTPAFHNLYEFNTGNDEERLSIGPYYAPFSLVYALAAAIGGRAFGWNITGLISIWLTFLFTWLLVRRFVSNEFVAAVSSTVAIALPYRWISLLGGSPTGFAMMWVPVIWLGIDMAVRDNSVRGGFAAGTAILFACWTDAHVFFFSVLAMPLWCLLALLRRSRGHETWPEICGKLVRSLAPVAVLTLLSIFFTALMERLTGLMTGTGLVADMVDRRSLEEVLLFSPGREGFFSWHLAGRWGEIYIGPVVLTVIAVCAIVVFLRSLRATGWARRQLPLIMALLIAGMAGIGILALGVRGPAGGFFLKIARSVIPPYGMIRQPAKIFCLMPSFLSVVMAIGLASLVEPMRGKFLRMLVPALCVIFVAAEYSLRFHPHICLLEDRQAAYAAVAERAAERDLTAGALVVPLWPGDSHYASVYQHFASLYRVRMVNGYTPFVKRDYFDNVFLRFKSLNLGELSDRQADELLGMGVEAILVHEDLFPEQVSPFPVTFTLRQLLNHPRLDLLKQDGTVWAFEILPQAVEGEDVAHWNVFGSARRREAQDCAVEDAVVVADDRAGGGAFVRLSGQGAGLLTSGEYLGRAPDMSWLVRMRGAGSVRACLLWEERPDETMMLSMEDDGWSWQVVPIENSVAYDKVSLGLELNEGVIDVDTIVMAAGTWEPPAAGSVLHVPAPAFFHAGHINRARDSVVFRTDRHANAVVFYGPKLPLGKGVYEVEMLFQTDAPPGTPLGWFNLRRRRDEPVRRNDVTAGTRAVAFLEHPENLIVSLEFVFYRNADMEIDAVTFRMLDEEEYN